MSCTIAKAGVESYLTPICYSWLTLLFYTVKCPFGKHAEILTLWTLGGLGEAANQHTHSSFINIPKTFT